MNEPMACAFKDMAGRDCLAWSQNEALAYGQDGTMRPLYEHAETEEEIVRKLDAMAVESLPPEIFKKWHEVLKTLCEARKNLNPWIPFDAGCDCVICTCQPTDCSDGPVGPQSTE